MITFEFKSLTSDHIIKISDFKDKVILIVNTASKCGLTGQYQALEALYQQFKDQGFVIIGIPCNDFGNQEPGTDDEIAAFCQKNYGVTFVITQKYAVTGTDAHPFYKKAKEIMGFTKSPQWNFHKYLINKKGELVDYFLPLTAPDSKRLQKAITNILDEQETNIAEHLTAEINNNTRIPPPTEALQNLLNHQDAPSIKIDIKIDNYKK